MLKNEQLNEQYSHCVSLMRTVEREFPKPVIMEMEDLFEKEQNEKKSYFGSWKAFQKSLKQAEVISGEMYDFQLKMKNLNINFRFLLNNAHNDASYLALARYFAEYAFYAQKLNRMGKNSHHPFVIEYVKNRELFQYNYFDIMFEAVESMEQQLCFRFEKEPEKYTLRGKDPENYISLDREKVKQTYKEHLKELKEKDKPFQNK